MLSEYEYSLPPGSIAHVPAEPRDAARLMVYDTAADTVALDAFAAIARYLPAGSLLVLNDTKVVPARLALARPTGGKANILFLANEWDRGPHIKGLPDREVKPGETLSLAGQAVAEAVSHENEEFLFKLLVSAAEFDRICEAAGQTPLPPYIHSDLGEASRRARYQTAFAAVPASVAAPTASLHFTDRVFESLDRKGVSRAAVTLHVGRGTFSPVTDEALGAGRLHEEPFAISAASSCVIREAKLAGRAVIAAGTTVMRTLESAADQIGRGEACAGRTSIFIRPPHEFRVADALITNFHLPGTSLLMLLDAFLQAKGAARSWRDLYELAIREGFRFYSFGDAMLIL